MEPHQPSRTAQGAALHRALHQLADRPPVFVDPLAVTIVGEDAAAELRERRDPLALAESAALRAFVAVRSRFAEDCLAEAVARGVRQYVILGAGLDTFGYRGPQADLRVFEVDHPATQAWKRARLAAMNILVPAAVTFAPVDFERETVADALKLARFDFAAPAQFAWLGVTPYLTQDAVTNTLAFVASLPSGTEIVFDYVVPVAERARDRASFDAMAERVAAFGEPFRGFFEPDLLVASARTSGFSLVEDLDAAALNDRYFRDRADGLHLRGRAHLMRARV